MQQKLDELKQLLAEPAELERVLALLSWDQSTYMPPGGTQARRRQSAIVGRLAHEKFTHPVIGRLLDEVQPYVEGLPQDSDEACLVRATRRAYDRAIKIPADFVERHNDHMAATYQAWTVARPNNDFAAVRPNLERTLELSRELANYFPGYHHIADPLIDNMDYGMRASTIKALFGDLRQHLVPLVQAIGNKEPVDHTLLHQHFPEDKQLAFGRDVVRQFGYDFQRGRLDKTHHPFMTSFSLGDVRITTRVKENDLSESLFSILHEAGHAMYEQGIRRDFESTPLAHGTSAGVHESQSRLWENVVGRSRGFWEYYFPRLQAVFPEQLGQVDAEAFYRAVNSVERSLIRTDADEVTYNLHVMLRFDLELQLLEGTLAIQDLPEAWRARYKEDLGIVPPDDRDGVLQDVHWYAFIIGGVFQGYTLGNILSAQFYAAAVKARPQIPADIGRGQFDSLHGWLRENIYAPGSKFTPAELVERVTGGAMQIGPYVAYLKAKYADIYGI
jgi:carboxypeptidase Taq